MNETLLTIQKNEVFQAIIDVGLSPTLFSWKQIKNSHEQLISVLKYGDTSYFFEFNFNLTKQRVSSYSPGNEMRHTTVFSRDWYIQILHVREWLVCLKNEISQPNYWDDLGKYLFSDINVDTRDNNPLTINEFERIEAAIASVREYLLSVEAANTRNFEIINEKLDYIINSARKQGRSDWVHTCIGAIMSLSISCAFSPDRTNEIWSIIKQSISNLLIA